MASEQVWVVAACFNEAAVISTFMERVTALPDVDHLLLIDDGSSDATVAVIRDWQRSHGNQAVAQHAVQHRHQAHRRGASLQRCSRASIRRQACCS